MLGFSDLRALLVLSQILCVYMSKGHWSISNKKLKSKIFRKEGEGGRERERKKRDRQKRVGFGELGQVTLH